MPQSRNFKNLKKQILKLRSHLLPKFSQTGQYSKVVHTRTLSFIFLSHAEMESYLEQRGKEVCQKAIEKFQNTGSLNRVVPSLLAFSGLKMELPPEAIAQPQSRQVNWNDLLYFKNRLAKAKEAYEKQVQSNNGIKEESILKILLPIGVNPDEIDTVWLADMNSFGIKRGEIAHTSIKVHRIITIPDPETEFNKVNDLLNGLEAIDLILNKLVNK
jgi:hypothetical protein